MRRIVAVMLWLAACGAVCGLMCGAACGGRSSSRSRQVPVEERFTGSFSPPPTANAEVVAEVNGERIYVADVERHARARRLPARAALDELVAEELLAQEARARGLTDAPEVVDARKKARVRLLLARGFEPGFDGPEDVPDADIDEVLANPNRKASFFHEHYQEVAFARLAVPEGADEQEYQAKADRLRAGLAAGAPKDRAEFGVLAKKLAAEQGVEITLMQFPTTRHHSTAEEFASLAFSIHEVGEISQAGRTPWGWDILFLYNIIPERNATKDEIRQELFEESRRRGFMRWSDKLMKSRQITRNEDWLDRLGPAATELLPGGGGF